MAKKKYVSPSATYTEKNKFDLSRGYEKPQKHFSFPSIGAVGALLISVFLFVAVHAKITGQEFKGLAYWLQVFQDCPVTIDISKLYNLIPPVDFPEAFDWAESIINFITNLINVFGGSVAVLINVLEMLLWFIGKFIFSFGG